LETAYPGITVSAANFSSCGPTGPIVGASTAVLSGMSLTAFASYPYYTTCSISFNIKLPDAIPAGLYTFSPEDLVGVEDPLGTPSVFALALADFSFTVVEDTRAPTVSLSPSSGAVSNAPFDVGISFDEPVDGFVLGDITITGGSISSLSSIGGGGDGGGTFFNNYVASVTPSGLGTVTVSVPADSAFDEADNGNDASSDAVFTVIEQADFSIEFTDDPVAAGDDVNLRFTITNNSATEAISAGIFTANLTGALSGLSSTGTLPTNPCGASSSISGTTFLIFTGGEVAASSSCVFDVTVAVPGGADSGSHGVTTSDLSYTLGSTTGLTSPFGSDQLQISGAEGTGAPVVFTKSFQDSYSLPGGSVVLDYTIVPAEGSDATLLAFTDDLDGALSGLVATGLPLSDVCGSGSTLSGTSMISLTGGNVTDGSSCEFSVTLTIPAGAASGDHVSTTGNLTGSQDLAGDVTAISEAGASDTLTVQSVVPTVVVDGPASDVGGDFTATFRFSEAVTGFVVGDIDVVNGTASAFTGSDADYSATITPTANGAVTVQVPADAAIDGDANGNLISNLFSVTKVTPVPEINVTGLGISIASGDLIASSTDGTDFGAVDATAGTSTRTFVIQNTGSGDLTLTGGSPVTFSGADAADFSVVSQPSSPIVAGSTVSFQVVYDPDAVAVDAAVLTLANDDADESSYTFTLAGEGLSAPEISVEGNATDISDGDVSPSASDDTDYGSVNVGSTLATTFTIYNTGGSTLTLGSDAVSVTASGADDFLVTVQPATTVAASGSTTFEVSYSPSVLGANTANIEINSDDADENPFNFGLAGNGIGGPEVNLTGLSVTIVDEDTTPSVSDDTDFGSSNVGSAVVHTFTIENNGTSVLSLVPAAADRAGDSAGSTIVDVFGSSDFTILSQPSSTVAAGSSSTFTVQFDPSSTGTISASLAFGSDDLDETRYDFAVEGFGTAPEIDVAGNSVSITDGDTTPASADGSLFADVGYSSGTDVQSFTISNSGNGLLTLGASSVSVSGTHASDFSVSVQPSTSVAASGSSDFEITFDPSAAGTRTATISIANDDADESPFDFAVSGEGLDNVAPSGFTVAFDDALINGGDASSTAFTFTSAEVGTTYDYTISTDGGSSTATGSGTITSAGQTISGIDVSGLEDGTLTLSVTLSDAVPNVSDAETDTATLDQLDPSVVLSWTGSGSVATNPLITITFSEDVTGFTSGDVTVGNGSVARFAGSGSVYSAEIQPTASGAVAIDIPTAVAQDAVGNDNTAATQLEIEYDATRPMVSVTSTSSGTVTGDFTVDIVFDEDVFNFVVGDITVGNGSASDFAGSGTTYSATITPAADGSVTVDVGAGVAEDAAGNINQAATQFALDADITSPTVASVVASDADLRNGDVGSSFTLTVTFAEALDPSTSPSLSFVGGDLSGTLSFASGAFSSGNTVYTATYDVSDGSVSVADIDVTVSGGVDVAGNTMSDETETDIFSVTMSRGTITITQLVAGSVDGEFDFTGDLGSFAVTTVGQTGSEVFSDLIEGSYTITPSAEDDFTFDTSSCVGGSTSIDGGTGAATVTLAPDDDVTCTFETVADPDVDVTVIPDVSISLASEVDDPTTQSVTFILSNTGGVPYYFTAATDVAWLDIDPVSGSIPASGTLEFTVTFTDGVLDLAPGDYTANIIVTEVGGVPQKPAGTQANDLGQVIIPVSVSLAPRDGTLTVISTTSPSQAGDDTFTYTSDLAELNGMSLTTSGGTASSGDLTILRGTYTLSQDTIEGWDLNSLTCSGDVDNGSVYDLANGTVTIDLDPEEVMVCTFANRRNEDYIVGITTSAIRDFMATRADQILSNGPRLSGRMRGTRASGTPSNFAADFVDGRFQANLSTSLSAIRNSVESSQKQMPGDEQFNLGGNTTGAQSLDIWVQANYSSIDDNRAGLDSQSSFGMFYIGADFMATEDILVGALMQFDQTETETGVLRSEVEGDGWMVGPYMVARLSDRIYFDARGAWGKSDNTINPIGLYTDEFETDRWLLEANLAGDIQQGNWRFSPEIGIAYFNEEQTAYTDSLGFLIPGQEITLGRISAGPEISYRFENPDGGFVEPYLRVTAMWDYDDAEVINAAGNLQGLGSFRTDARFGLTAELSNGGLISGEVSMQGIGEGEFEANSAMFRVRLPLSLHSR